MLSPERPVTADLFGIQSGVTPTMLCHGGGFWCCVLVGQLRRPKVQIAVIIGAVLRQCSSYVSCSWASKAGGGGEMRPPQGKVGGDVSPQIRE